MGPESGRIDSKQINSDKYRYQQHCVGIIVCSGYFRLCVSFILDFSSFVDSDSHRSGLILVGWIRIRIGHMVSDLEPAGQKKDPQKKNFSTVLYIIYISAEYSLLGVRRLIL